MQWSFLFEKKGEKYMKNESKNDILEKDYFNDLKRIKETIKLNQNKAMVYVNSAMIMTYYEIGTIINERKTWGSKYVQRLSNDLKEYGKGYSFENLRKMAQFASIFSKEEIWLQPVTKIPWSTIIQIISKSSSKEEMFWYINQTYKNTWSRRMVLEQFKVKAFERKLIEPQVTDIVKQDNELKDIFKDTLSFDFLGRINVNDEKDLKEKLIDKIISFLQELGPGFSLVGKEYRLVTPSKKNYYIDLLMYHTY